MSVVPLSASELTQRVAALPPVGSAPWRLEGGALAVDLRFGDFEQAFAFMTAVALHAQRVDHHPDWSNVYRDVSIRLRTHDANGITERDMAMAQHIGDLARRWLAH